MTGIDIEDIVLLFGRFGPANMVTKLKDGIMGSEHHDVARPYYRLGTVVNLWHKGDTSGSVQGWSEFVYGNVEDGGNATAIAASVFACPETMTEIFNFMTDSGNAAVAGGPLGVCCISAVTDTYYGWFWSGGVAPIDFTDMALNDAVTTGASIVAGCPIILVDSGNSYVVNVGTGAAGIIGHSLVVGA